MTDLAALFTAHGLLADTNGDGLPDAVRARLVVDDRAPAAAVAAACDLAARLGLETMALDLPLGLLESEAARLPGGAAAVRLVLAQAGAAAARPGRAGRPGRGWAEVRGTQAGRPEVVVAGETPAALRRVARALATWLTWPGAGGVSPLARAAGGRPVARVEVGPRGGVTAWVVTAGRRRAVRVRRARAPGGFQEPTAEPGAGSGSEPQAQPTTAPVPGRPGVGAGVGWSLATVFDVDRHGRDAVRRLGEFPGLLTDTDGDWIPDDARAVLVLERGVAAAGLIGAVDVAARLGLESTGLTWPVAVLEGDDLPAGRIPVRLKVGAFRPGAGSGVRALGTGEGATLQVEGGTPEALRSAGRYLARALPRVVPDPGGAAADRTFRDLEEAAEELLAGRSPAGQAADALRLATGATSGDLPGTVALDRPPPGLSSVLTGRAGRPVAVVDRRETRREAEFHWEGPWEVDVFWERYRTRIRPALADLARAAEPAPGPGAPPPDVPPPGARPADAPLTVEVGLSEPDDVLDAVVAALRQDLAAVLPGAPARAECLCAYKPGLSWLRRVVLPALAGLRPASVRLAVAPVEAPPGGPRRYELRTRWLQEAYPAREILAATLGLPAEAVVLGWGERGGPAYRLEARDPDGTLCHVAEFTPPVRAMPYVRAYPHRGSVHPTTGWIRVSRGERVLAEETFPTDREAFWDFYQDGVLPELFRRVPGWLEGSDGHAHPVFASLRVDVWLSEPDDVPLGVRHERLSALEALHEDLYFVTLDGFRFAGEELAGEPLRAPGLVEPWVHAVAGTGPSARVTVERWTAPRPGWVRPDGGLTPVGQGGEAPPGTVRAESVTLDTLGRVVRVQLRAQTADPAVYETWTARLTATAELCAAGVALDLPALPAGLAGSGGVQLTVEGPAGQAAEYALHPAPAGDGRAGQAPAAAGAVEPAPAPSPETAPGVPMDQVLSWEAAARLGGHLAERHPEITYREAGRTFWGRPVGVLEVSLPAGGTLASRAKAVAWKCTFLVQARHHANEISSTNAGLRLAELLAADPAWRPALDRLNVVIIPVANVDGAELGYKLQLEHPRWMHHAARWNGCGLEYGRELFNPETPYPEALVLPGVWARWLPDLVVDDHGYPNHEWVQPFAGYGPPGFPSFWIPRGLFYGIMSYPPGPEGEAARAFAGRVRDAVIEAVNADPEIRAAVLDALEAFRTYGTAWLPDVVPLEADRGMVFYFSPWERDGAWRPLHGRFPRVTALGWITEVADETVQGNDLETAARAHLVADLAQVRLLAEVHPGLRREARPAAEGFRLTLGRARPLWRGGGG